MLCSTPTILSFFLQGSVVRLKKVRTALTAWIWRASHFWLSKILSLQKKKKPHRFFWFFYILIVFIWIFQHCTIFSSPWEWQKTKQRFFYQWLSSEISQMSLSEKFFYRHTTQVCKGVLYMTCLFCKFRRQNKPDLF